MQASLQAILSATTGSRRRRFRATRSSTSFIMSRSNSTVSCPQPSLWPLRTLAAPARRALPRSQAPSPRPFTSGLPFYPDSVGLGNAARRRSFTSRARRTPSSAGATIHCTARMAPSSDLATAAQTHPIASNQSATQPKLIADHENARCPPKPAL